MSDSEIVIKVEGLWKQYRLGTIGGKTLREDMSRWWAKLRGKPDPLLTVDQLQAQSSLLPAPRSILPSPDGHIWALRDINFEVKQGEILGIIGPNGAGKSTFLKILTGITAPTKGRAFMKGRVGALLEVGTGFHPELTGRENIFLSGAILGMTKAEVQAKLDEIIDFSGCERYIDTPIKRYSSGMNVRLAFAVAAHLEPEILLIDEVLAVGDAAFQKKCLGKMEDVAKEGRTVLFVSHNMTAVEALCSKTMLISGGKNIDLGSTPEIIRQYLEAVSNDASLPLDERKDRRGKGYIRFKEIMFAGNKNSNANVYTIGDDICVYTKIKNVYRRDVTVRLALSINTTHETLISCDSALKGKTYTILGSSESTLVCRIYSPPLNYGNYFINIAIFYGGEPEDWITSAASFSIESGRFDNHITTNHFPVLSRFEWDIESQV